MLEIKLLMSNNEHKIYKCPFISTAAARKLAKLQELPEGLDVRGKSQEEIEQYFLEHQEELQEMENRWDDYALWIVEIFRNQFTTEELLDGMPPDEFMRTVQRLVNEVNVMFNKKYSELPNGQRGAQR